MGSVYLVLCARVHVEYTALSILSIYKFPWIKEQTCVENPCHYFHLLFLTEPALLSLPFLRRKTVRSYVTSDDLWVAVASFVFIFFFVLCLATAKYHVAEKLIYIYIRKSCVLNLGYSIMWTLSLKDFCPPSWIESSKTISLTLTLANGAVLVRAVASMKYNSIP